MTTTIAVHNSINNGSWTEVKEWADAVFLPDGRFAAAGSIWSSEGAHLHEIGGEWVRCVLASDDRLVVVEEGEGRVRSWDFDGAPQGLNDLVGAAVGCLACSLWGGRGTWIFAIFSASHLRPEACGLVSC